jgi:hypothetical protein
MIMKKTVKFNQDGIEKLPNNKPVIYRIGTDGEDNYIGVAKRGRVQERLKEHLPGAQHPVPGSKVSIEQMQSIRQAEQKEKKIIEKEQPRYNDRHK